jgi:hypothetical protein
MSTKFLRSLRLLVIPSILTLAQVAWSDVHNLRRSLDQVEEAMRLAGVYGSFRLDFYGAASRVDDVVFNMRLEPATVEQRRVLSSAQIALRTLRDHYASDFTKTSTMRREGDVMRGQLQRMIELEEGRWEDPRDPIDEPACDSLVDALNTMEQVVSEVQFRNYLGAERLLFQIQRLLSQHRFDRELGQARHSVDRILSVLRDRFGDDWTKASATRRHAADFREFVVRSEAYRRERGGYNPPHPYPNPRPNPPYPNPPYPNPPHSDLRTVDLPCASWDRSAESCRAPFVIGRVLRVNTHSSVRCVEGLNYRVNFDSIEVWDGCRASFLIEERSGRRHW